MFTINKDFKKVNKMFTELYMAKGSCDKPHNLENTADGAISNAKLAQKAWPCKGHIIYVQNITEAYGASNTVTTQSYRSPSQLVSCCYIREFFIIRHAAPSSLSPSSYYHPHDLLVINCINFINLLSTSQASVTV